MGSEAGKLKYSDELLHPVTISKGFWMSQLPFCIKPGVVDSFTDMQEALNIVRVFGGESVLATEAEWEYACRAGTRTCYNFGNQYFPKLFAPATPTSIKKAEVPVGFFPPNAWGLQHMHGLVWELCQDYYLADLRFVQQTDPVVLSTNTCRYRVVRGGAYYLSSPVECSRSAARFTLTTQHAVHVGLRLVHRHSG